MYSKTLLLLVICSIAIQVQAACNCQSNDRACYEQCVNDTNQCISSCNGETNCYNQCIENDWPGQQGQTASGASVSETSPATSGSVATDASSAQATSAATSTDAAVTSSIASVVSSASSSIASAASSIVSAASSVQSSLTASASASQGSASAAASTTPQASGANKAFLVPGVGIGVAMFAVLVQFVFLSRVGSLLFQ